MPRHRWKILIGLATAFVLLTVIELMMTGNGPKREVEAYKKSLIAKGEKLEISELIPTPVPNEENGADLVNQALSLLTRVDTEDSSSIPAMRMIAPGIAIVCFEQPDVREFNSTNSWANELALVADDRPMDELLRQAAAYPAIDFHLDYSKRFATQLQFIRPLIAGSGRLSAEALCDLNRGNPASAATNVCAILALVNGQQDELLEPAQLIRMTESRIAAETTWELLQSTNLNDWELALLQANWERIQFIRPMENTLLMERAQNESEILKMQDSDEYFHQRTQWGLRTVDWSGGWHNGFDDVLYNARLVCTKSMYHASWIYWDELHMLQNDQIMLQTIRTVERNQFFNPAYSNMLNQLDAQAAVKPHDLLANVVEDYYYKWFSSMNQMGDVVSRILETEAARKIAIAAIALKRYQLKHAHYPVALSDLIPEFVSSVPRDPVDGQPLRYRLMPGGNFLLYSIGVNGKDDGGDSSIGTIRESDLFASWDDGIALDWVWPQPATPAEIQYFYALPPEP